METVNEDIKDADFSEITEDELNELENDKYKDIDKTSVEDDEEVSQSESDGSTDKTNVYIETCVENADRHILDADRPILDADRPILNNNFILPMESVETVTSMEEEIVSKKQKHEKKDGRFYKFVKKHFLQRKNNSNDVQEIRIVPDGDELKWARRSAGSAASRSSNDTTSSDGDRLEVVHDMAEEYIPEV